MAESNAQQVKRPELGEQTKHQTHKSGVWGVLNNLPGFGEAPRGSFATYRTMRNNPTIALARIAATAPIRTANWSVEAQDGVPEDRTMFIQEQIESVWPMLVKEVLMSLDYGFQAFEKVWEIRDGKLVYRKLKPLRPDITKPVIEQDTGTFAGLKQGGVALGPEKCFWYTYDGEAGNLYGRSRHENVREHAWHPWVNLSKKRGQYATKVSGVIPMIQYPVGESEDADGATKSNFELAQAVLENLGRGNGVAMPNTLSTWAEELARKGVDLAQLQAWMISFLEVKGAHGKEITDMMRHCESLMLRGWLVPERAVIEGQFGTKAEAAQHATVALVAADLVLQDILRNVNWYVINPLLVLNFGRESENSVYLSRAGLDPEQQAFFRTMMQNVLGAPPNVDLFLAMLDLDAMLDAVGLPKSEENVKAPVGNRPVPENQPQGKPAASLTAAVLESYRLARAKL